MKRSGTYKLLVVRKRKYRVHLVRCVKCRYTGQLGVGHCTNGVITTLGKEIDKLLQNMHFCLRRSIVMRTTLRAGHWWTFMMVELRRRDLCVCQF